MQWWAEKENKDWNASQKKQNVAPNLVQTDSSTKAELRGHTRLTGSSGADQRRGTGGGEGSSCQRPGLETGESRALEQTQNKQPGSEVTLT